MDDRVVSEQPRVTGRGARSRSLALPRRRPVLALAAAASLLGVGAAEIAETSGAGQVRQPMVTVRMSDYAFALSKTTVRRGTVSFKVVNVGEVVHDFKIAGRKTPIYAAGGGGVLVVTFRRPGRYPFICTVPGHTAAGMKGVLKVVA